MMPLAIQTLNGLSFGMLLFLLAAGLSLIYGLMRIINITHGSYYLVGGYVGLTVVRETGNFLVAVIAAALSVGAVGMIMERFFLRRVQHQMLRQTLLTFGFLFLFADLSLAMWGGNPATLPVPAPFARSVQLAGVVYPSYRLLLIAVGFAVAAALWWFQERTRFGAMVRAGVDNEEIARALGINVSLMSTLVFGVGALLAGIGGVLAGPMLGVYPGADLDVLLLGFVVVIIGGLGSLKGALVGAILVGLLDTYGKAYFPEFALFSVFVPMVVILAIKPTGLWGRQ
jgi:branched-chain amino acid transport system permease protein